MTELQISVPDQIFVQESHFEDVDASTAKLRMTIKGTSYFNSAVAFKKARELATLVDALKAVGLAETDFKLLKVSAEVASGIFTKFSSVNYRIQAHCRELDKLPDVLTAIANAKTVVLEGIDWQYEDDQGRKDEWLKVALAKAIARANVMAAALGVSVHGIHECVSTYWNEQENDFGPPRIKSMGMVRSRADYEYAERMQPPGFQLTGSERRGVNVQVAFKVSS